MGGVSVGVGSFVGEASRNSAGIEVDGRSGAGVELGKTVALGVEVAARRAGDVVTV